LYHLECGDHLDATDRTIADLCLAGF
jgi:hypothetical protein